MILLFIGPSGSGKDTQAEILTDKYDFKRVSTGDLLREISEGKHDIQKIIRQSMNEGFLADNFVFGLLQTYLTHLNHDKIILSGSVRRFSQIELLDFALFKLNKKLDKVVYFDLSDEEATKRMTSRVRCPQCGTNYNLIYNPPKEEMKCDIDGATLTRRPDDSEEGMKNRLAEFHKDNDEILEEYDKRGILLRMDASKTIEEVSNELINKLGFY
jgi:adenylate kinase